MPDRDLTGSLLTPSQREFLSGDTDTDPTESHGRTIRTRIRDRVKAAFTCDFHHLLHSEAFTLDDFQNSVDVTSDAVIDGLEDGVAVIYLAAVESRFDFERIAENAIRTAERKRGNEVTGFNLEIETVQINQAELHQRIVDGDPSLDFTDVLYAFREQIISEDEFWEYNRQIGDQSPLSQMDMVAEKQQDKDSEE